MSVSDCCGATDDPVEAFCRDCDEIVCSSCASVFESEDGYGDDGRGVRTLALCKDCHHDRGWRRSSAKRATIRGCEMEICHECRTLIGREGVAVCDRHSLRAASATGGDMTPALLRMREWAGEQRQDIRDRVLLLCDALEDCSAVNRRSMAAVSDASSAVDEAIRLMARK